MSFEYIILDYFFTPSGYACDRWSDKFYKDTLPQLVDSRVLQYNGVVILPHLKCVEDCLKAFQALLCEYYDISLCDVHQNPLHAATDLVRDCLLLCPDKIINESQMKPLMEISNLPFYLLKNRKVLPDW